MRRSSLIARFLPIALTAAAALAGCATGGGTPLPPPPPAPAPLDTCDTVKNSVSVIIDAKTEGTLKTSLPKKHEVEVCKNDRSVIWFAKSGRDMSVVLEPDKDPTIPPANRGKAAEKPACGNVTAKDGTPLGAICWISIHGSDKSGRIPYTLTVTPMQSTDPVAIDPQMIIRP